MKIIDERRKETTYGDLEIGAVFEVYGDICMKTSILEPGSFSNKHLLSINLRTGTEYVIPSDVEISPIDANLVLVR